MHYDAWEQERGVWLAPNRTALRTGEYAAV
jgi:hypothetical protein